MTDQTAEAVARLKAWVEGAGPSTGPHAHMHVADLRTLLADRERLRLVVERMLCEDCPRVGHSTDKTRCEPCPRRAALNTQGEGE